MLKTCRHHDDLQQHCTTCSLPLALQPTRSCFFRGWREGKGLVHLIRCVSWESYLLGNKSRCPANAPKELMSCRCPYALLASQRITMTCAASMAEIVARKWRSADLILRMFSLSRLNHTLLGFGRSKCGTAEQAQRPGSGFHVVLVHVGGCSITLLVPVSVISVLDSIVNVLCFQIHVPNTMDSQVYMRPRTRSMYILRAWLQRP